MTDKIPIIFITAASQIKEDDEEKLAAPLRHLF